MPHEVCIVRQNFDYYHEEGYEDDQERLNPNGELFQVVFAYEGTVRSVPEAKKTVQEAVSNVELRLQEHQLTWTNHRLQKLCNARYYLLAGD